MLTRRVIDERVWCGVVLCGAVWRCVLGCSGYAIGKIKTLLIGSLLAAVAWPMYMYKVSNFIDDSYAGQLSLTHLTHSLSPRPVTIVHPAIHSPLSPLSTSSLPISDHSAPL